ncbi:MAG: hypothetical protein Unbinned8622contig1005_4 [Prokaryotic dsDNA virus sp.]|nr:MAG: hypothetical protein Unbinned8622contig1005_4 [Prokaryotic dsDNA virus sp.]|tara:strand:+ start:3542 stop:4702 length:1161 start_codon:yes stop_codon:yes gene_type:complete
MKHPLLEFCDTEKQLKVVTLCMVKGMSQYQAADKLGTSRDAVRSHLNAVKNKAARRGYSPDHDWKNPVPDGHKIKGVSTFYDEAGLPVRQWVKSQTDEERQFEILVERLEAAQEGLKPFKRVAAPKAADDDLLTLLTITDFHLGMYAYEAETGDDWDMRIARDVFLNSISDMIKASPKSGTGVLCQLGDFLHWDGILSVTPQSGHILDADTRYGKLVEMVMSVMTEAVKMMLRKFERVVVISAEGNHDISGSIWLRKHIKHLFANEPRLEVIDNDFPYYAYLHGETMLGFHHGHKVKLANLHKLFASEPRFREMWGSATTTYIHTGHYHHERVVEDGGAVAEMHPTLSGRDAYAARGGWVSRRGAKAITYHKTEGEVARITVRPRI